MIKLPAALTGVVLLISGAVLGAAAMLSFYLYPQTSEARITPFQNQKWKRCDRAVLILETPSRWPSTMKMDRNWNHS